MKQGMVGGSHRSRVRLRAVPLQRTVPLSTSKLLACNRIAALP